MFKFEKVEVKEESIKSLQKILCRAGEGSGRTMLQAPHVFMLPSWMQSWWDSCGEGYELFLRSIHLDGEPVGIVPLVCKGQVAYLLGSPDICDYLDFIVAPGREGDFFQALPAVFGGQDLKKLVLHAQRPDAAIFKVPAFNRQSPGWPFRVKYNLENESFEHKLPGDWEGYLASLGKKQRHEVRRKIRRLERETNSYRYREMTESDEISAFLPAFLGLLRNNPDKKRFMTDRMEEYFYTLLNNTSAEGLARFGVLEIDGTEAAAVLYFDYLDRINLYNSGYDSAYRDLSAGLLSKVFCLRHSLQRGKRVFDFLKGKEIYKRRLGGASIPIYKVVVDLDSMRD